MPSAPRTVLVRTWTAVAAVAALLPAALAVSMVVQTPRSALTVPKVHVAMSEEPMRLDPQSLGASRTSDGLQIHGNRLDRTLEVLSRRISRDPVPGRYEKTDQGIVVNRGVPGVALDVPAARAMLVEALRGGLTEVVLPVREVAPPAPQPFAIVVRLSEFRLDLYEGTVLRKRYPVGVGALRFPTPPGEYHIRSKAKNPTWNNPGSAWARAMPKRVPPGPRNPLGTRALRLDRDALVIHGTPQPATVGRRSSHGCMRMHRAEVEELFDIVPIGTPVFIIP